MPQWLTMVHLTYQGMLTRCVVNQCTNYFLKLEQVEVKLDDYAEFLSVPNEVVYEIRLRQVQNAEWVKHKITELVLCSTAEVKSRLGVIGAMCFLETEWNDITSFLAFCTLLTVCFVKVRGEHWVTVISSFVTEIMIDRIVPWMESRGGWNGYFKYCGVANNSLSAKNTLHVLRV